jgi:NADH-quinone oxidoreductase subunit J
MPDLIFSLFAALTLGGALALLLTRNVLYAAFFLLLTLLGVAALFVLAGADLLAMAQLLIYVGGVLVLIIFGVMLTHSPERQADSQQPNQVLTGHRNRLLAVGLAGAVFFGLFALLSRATFGLLTQKPTFQTSIDTIGRQLMTEYSLPFELTGILLLAALIGATYLAAQTNPKNADEAR